MSTATVMASAARVHGGPDTLGVARWDFSTCANAAGPCPQALAAVQGADTTRYPDGAGAAVRRALADLHGVEPWRVLAAASASEFIQRCTVVSARLWPGAVGVPVLAYGDYAAAARACGRALRVGACGGDEAVTLDWHAEPSSPLGQDSAPPPRRGRCPAVLDAVYAPLRLCGTATWPVETLDQVFVLHSPSKALGLSGVRGAYAVAPRDAAWDVQAGCAALDAAAPSWPWSAHAEAMLASWATRAVQRWVASSRETLAEWKADLREQLAARGFTLWPSVAPHFVARPARPLDAARLRAYDVAVRDTTSFGLAGCWRLNAQPPAAQQALMQALQALEGGRP